MFLSGVWGFGMALKGWQGTSTLSLHCPAIPVLLWYICTIYLLMCFDVKHQVPVLILLLEGEVVMDEGMARHFEILLLSLTALPPQWLVHLSLLVLAHAGI